MDNDLTLSGEQSRRILRLYHLYRLIIGTTLVLLVSSDLHTDLLDMAQPALFRNGSWLYLALNVLIIATARKPKRLAQIFSLALVDVILLSGLFYAGGGTPSGIGNLLIVAVAISQHPAARTHRPADRCRRGNWHDLPDFLPQPQPACC